jgi:hypothetical protein
MTTGLERDVQRPASSLSAGPLERNRFGMWKSRPTMIAQADDPPSIDDDRPDHWIRACSAAAFRRQVKGRGHVTEISLVRPHRSRIVEENAHNTKARPEIELSRS